jgi:predicted lipid-binding transport protein (Tim44 family)
MGDGFQFIDIILFALVAGFLILRLRSVLGRRDGHQSRAPDPFVQPPTQDRPDDGGVRLPERNDRPAEAPRLAQPEPTATTGAGSVEAGLAQIKTADPRFDADEFVSGARIAFELILHAFAAGDIDTLKPLLSAEVFANFQRSIRDRQAAKHRLETKLVAIKSAEVLEAYMAGRTAHVTVKFVSEQISATYDETSGAVIEGDPNVAIEVTDYWTFARDTRSPDPNWILVATGSPE